MEPKGWQCEKTWPIVVNFEDGARGPRTKKFM